jgi:hypothetical protein
MYLGRYRRRGERIRCLYPPREGEALLATLTTGGYSLWPANATRRSFDTYEAAVAWLDEFATSRPRPNPQRTVE